MSGSAITIATVSPLCIGHATPMRPPLATPFRACELCVHSAANQQRLLCDSPATRLAGGPQPVDVARSTFGSCGPNARHLDMPAWH